MEEIVSERRITGVSWKGIWAGLFVVCGVEVVMQLFGVAVGVSAMNPRGDLSGVSLWTGIWAIISTLSAFFFGGWAASAVSAPLRRSAGAFEGLLVWAFVVTVATVFLSGATGLTVQRLVPNSAIIAQLHTRANIGAAWVAFGTVFLSLCAAVAGGVLGCGPTLRRRRTVTYAPPVTTPPVTTY